MALTDAKIRNLKPKDKPWEHYHQIIVDTYEASKSGKASKVHVRLIEGQLYSSRLDVRCSRAMRNAYPIGTKFKIYAKLTDREGGGEFLHSHHDWPYEVLKPSKG